MSEGAPPGPVLRETRRGRGGSPEGEPSARGGSPSSAAGSLASSSSAAGSLASSAAVVSNRPGTRTAARERGGARLSAEDEDLGPEGSGAPKNLVSDRGPEGSGPPKNPVSALAPSPALASPERGALRGSPPRSSRPARISGRSFGSSNASALAPPSPRRHADHRSPCAVTAAISPSRAATATTRGGAGRVRKARSASGPESSRRYSEASPTVGASVGRTIAGPV